MVKLYDSNGKKVVDTELDVAIKEKKKEKKKLSKQIKELSLKKSENLDSSTITKLLK